MALATATITYDIADLTGVDFDARRTRVWVTTNIPDGTIADTAGNQVRLGDGRGTLADDGTGSVTVWVPGAGSNPASWQTSLHVDYQPRGGGGRAVRNFGPFTITTDANLADLVAEQAVPAAAVGGDAAVAGFVSSSSSATAAALSASYVGVGKLCLDVRDFGAKVDGATNDTAALQAALDAANASGGRTPLVYIPSGTAMFTHLVLPERVTVRGAGKNRTTLQVIGDGSTTAAVSVAPGYTDNLFVEDLKIRGAGGTNPGQVGFLADALGNGATPDTGGWGNGGMRRVEISNFSGDEIWLRGKGVTSAYHQHQFLVFEHCDFSARDLARACTISGKNGQLTFINCQFSYGGGSNLQPGLNLNICRELADDGTTVVADSYAYALDFYNCSIEGRAAGVRIETAQTVNFYGAFFERLAKGVEVVTAAKNINLYSPHFANAGTTTNLDTLAAGDGSGFLVRGGVTVNVYNPNIAGIADKSFVDLVRVIGGEQVPGIASLGVSTDTSPSAGTLDLKSATTAFTRGTISTIATRNHLPGAVIYLNATTSDITLTTAGNISLSGSSSPMTVPVGSMVALARFDGAKDWRVVAVSTLSTSGSDYLSTQAVSAGTSTMPRQLVISSSVTMPSGALRLSYFTGRKSETVTSVRVPTGGTAAGATPSLVRIGLFTVDASANLTLVASTANDTTLFAAASTPYTKAFSTPYSMVAGQRYALGILVVTAAAAPTLNGSTAVGGSATSEAATDPRLCGQVASQTDLPASITAGTVANTSTTVYGVVIP